MRNGLVLALLLVACEGEPPSLAKDPERVSPAPTASVPTPVGPTGRCVAGWRATMRQRMGVASYTVTIECKVGWPMLTVDTGSSGTRLVAMYWSDWATLWEELEAAQWRSLHPACPRLRDLGRVLPELELEVTDGQETKKVACPVVSDIQHQRVMKAFEQVLARSR